MNRRKGLFGSAWPDFSIGSMAHVVTRSAVAQPPELPDPSVVDRNLAVRAVIRDLITPIDVAFLGPNDMFGLEKNTGRVLRVIDGKAAAADGSAPEDNPFAEVGRTIGGEVGTNLRNSFGLAFDPLSGRLWQEETATIASPS